MFNEQETTKKLKRYLPQQATLKDFVHHNTLHGFQNLKFDQAIQTASRIFGYKVSLSIREYRELYKKHRIREDILEQVIIRRKGKFKADEWIHNLFHKKYDESIPKRIKSLRGLWLQKYDFDMDDKVHPILFRLISVYLDQGISIWKMPINPEGLLATVRDLQEYSFFNVYKSKRVKKFLYQKDLVLSDLLNLLVDDPSLYEQYLFDQQFTHPGWSGIISTIEDHPEMLLDSKKVLLRDLVVVETLLEIDALDSCFGEQWKPISQLMEEPICPLFDPVETIEEHDVISIWQEAFEWSHYDEVLTGIVKMKYYTQVKPEKTFQALFCIDDREGSLRRHIENEDPKCETYGTPGHFGMEFYYQPLQGKFHTKVCPSSIIPRHIIKEVGEKPSIKKDIHFSKKSYHPIWGCFFSLIVGFFSGFRLFVNIFKPNVSPAASSSFSHMGKTSRLTIESKDSNHVYKGLQIGFTIDEMTDRAESVLKSIGLTGDFSSLVYVIGHGASSINNTHYAGYDCGACSGRPGSVNARVFSHVANHTQVREKLRVRGIDIPDQTQFIGGIHDTTRDDIEFYDEEKLTSKNQLEHQNNLRIFSEALDMNAKERSRRFLSFNSRQEAHKVREKIKERSVSLFEPRPELNHATNSLCIVGRHSLHEGLFLDRRAFSNSYNYRLDPLGTLLENILNAATPVCGGINLEYYFSRVDNQKLGAGSKLPHNVVGLIGVSNGVDGDLRPGLPKQMIEVHDPLRLLMIVEHYPEVVLETIKRNSDTYEWYLNEWVNLVAVHPISYDMYVFREGKFVAYQPLKRLLDTIHNEDEIYESNEENLPVYLIKK